jgi:colicin import membrane protein
LNKAPVAETFVPEPKMTNNPLFNVKPSFRALVQKNKERRVVNAVKLAAKKTALSRASGSERVKMARNLAPAKQENVKKVANAIKIFNRQSAISAVNRLKKLSLAEKTRFKGQISGASTKERVKEIETSAIREDARKKAEENKKKEDERKKRADAEAERVRKLEVKKATRAAAERAAISAKKMLTETEKMKAKAAENKKFNDRLAEKRRLLREREAKSEPKKRKSKKKQ